MVISICTIIDTNTQLQKTEHNRCTKTQPPDVSQRRGCSYLYHCAAHIWCCPTPVEMMALPPVSSQRVWIASWGKITLLSDFGNVIGHLSFCSSSSSRQLEKSGTAFGPWFCWEKKKTKQTQHVTGQK